jgi:hypothetical protein
VALAWLGLELLQHRGVVGGCPLLEDSAVVVHYEDVEQLPDDLASVGLQCPIGDWVNSRTKVPSIQVWQAMVSPSTTMMPRRIKRSSNPARTEAK